ncbi:hypothetical protein E3N88_02623 [Mikania micrantha]|uniref:Uncharacterized protein n=1 Tax=Mikania micrantha TaxID=192012 RepID=A0A5N6Q6U3_9ASTR|nr:hypothetical protein E3N88_02623 [Mikania micrantha]
MEEKHDPTQIVEDGEEGVCEAAEVAIQGVEEERSKMEGMASIALFTEWSTKEQDVVVERRGHDAARFCNVDHAHGSTRRTIKISFECETLKADEAAEEHIRRFMPKLTGMDAVVNMGKMSITGLDFKAELGHTELSS